ncbi:MAG TPA: NADH-quinone oxidoreductase subunit N, partial [Abditibacteriaceae bacterium]|nr:NADH-quinone oxidoreductase subunit N [Abditibacteriaceae bacterium]
MMMVAAARDLLVIFLGIETLSIALYILAGFARTRLISTEAALKYFLLGAFASGFLLYGIALTYFATGSTLLSQIVQRLPNQIIDRSGTSTLLSIGLALILIGLSFKAALVPFHQWTPDVYEGSPTPVTAFMAVGAKAAAFAALMRVFPGTFSTPIISVQWHTIMLVMAVLTMTIGNVVAIMQNSLKRMLAYSSIAHAGYILIGVLAAGSALRNGSPDAALRANAGVMFYLLVYTLMTLGAFAVLVHLENLRAAEGNPDWDSEDANIPITEIQGLAWQRPLTAAAFTVFMLSLIGIPPTAGFFGKLFIFWEAMDQGLYGLLIVGVLNTVISAYYYLRPVVAMYMQEESRAVPVAVPSMAVATDGAVAGSPSASASGLSLAVVAAIAICTVVVLGMVVLQSIALDWAGMAGQQITGMTSGY